MTLDLTFEASDPQADFLELDNRYEAFIGGVGSGKTYAGAQKAFILSGEKERQGMTGLIGAPTYPMLRDVVIPTVFEVFPEGYITNWNRKEHKMELLSGSTILFRPMENELQINRLRGLNINWFWVDEPGYIPHYGFLVLQGRIRQGRHQKGLITGTPKGARHWIHEHFIQKRYGQDYGIIKDVASDTNPFISREYYADLQQSYTAEYLQQEFYGKFVKFEGLVYLEFDEARHVLPVSRESPTWKPGMRTIKTMDFKRFIYGYDAGYTNPRVFLKIGVTPNDEYAIVREFYRRKCRLSDAIPEFQKMYDGDGTCYADPSAKGEIAELNNKGIPTKKGDNDVRMGIQRVKELLDLDLHYVSEDCQNTINEFHSYRWDEEKDKPVKEDDHAMDADRYGVYTDGGKRLTIAVI